MTEKEMMKTFTNIQDHLDAAVYGMDQLRRTRLKPETCPEVPDVFSAISALLVQVDRLEDFRKNTFTNFNILDEIDTLIEIAKEVDAVLYQE